MMNTLKIFCKIIVFVILASICGCTILPAPSVSKYFETISAKVITEMSGGEYKHSLRVLVKQTQKLPDTAYLEISFENPKDKSKPIMIKFRPKLHEKEITITSPFIEGLKRRSDCLMQIYVYEDDTRNNLLDIHRQNIFVIFPEDSTDIALEPWEFDFDAQNLVAQYSRREKNYQRIEYFRKNETAKKWAERFSSAIYGYSKNAVQLHEGYIKFIVDSGYVIDWNIISEDENNIIYEIIYEGTDYYKPYGEIGRFYQYGNKTFSLTYLAEFEKFESQKDKLITAIRNARLK